jgi:alpha-tubulin suppressor-like RCC1 family protein
VKMSGLTGVVDVFAGRDHNLAVTAGGAVYAWGYNANGELGNGGSTNSNKPVRVLLSNGSALANVVQVTAGANHSLGLRADGTVVGWGRNNYGQIGDGTFSTRRRAVLVKGLSGVAQIAGGRQNSIAVTAGGSVYTWGEDIYGQLGDGSVSNTGRNLPGLVPGLANVSAVGAGRDYGMAVVAAS